MKNHNRIMPCLVMCSIFSLAGCSGKKSNATKETRGNQMSLKETEANYLAPLESTPDFERCKTSLIQLNAYDESMSSRPEMPADELRELTAKLRLGEQEAEELAQKSFNTADAAYLEQSLTLKAAIQAMDLSGKSPLEQSKLVFDWVCRMVYVNDRIPWPAPPALTLESGQGVHLSRAFLLQAAWQQIGLTGCYIGPRLADAPAYVVGDSPGDKGTLAPVRLCGVKIGKEVYLFNHVTGEPVLGLDRKSILKWSELTANLELGKDIADVGQVSQWKLYLSFPSQALSARMAWLNSKDPGKIGVSLNVNYLNVLKEFQTDLAPSPVDGWFVSRDKDLVGVSLQRLLTRYSTEEGKGVTRGSRIRQEYQLGMIPFELLPQIVKDSISLGNLRAEFASPFLNLHFGQNSATQLMIRGQFKEATTQISDVRSLAETARTRSEQDSNLKANFLKWNEALRTLIEAMGSASKSGDSAQELTARQHLEAFIKDPQSTEIQRAWVWGSASRAILAETNYMLAICVFERTYRQQIRGSKPDASSWKTVLDWWDRYLDSSALLNGQYKNRDAHARGLRAKAAEFAANK